jgi:hypothetical protein
MNYGFILRRAFELTRRYRVLWLFGILVALTAGGSMGTSNYSFDQSDFSRTPWPQGLPGEEAWRQLGAWFQQIEPGQWIGMALALCCLLLILALVALVLQYVARVALIRSVDQIETTAAAPAWRAAFRLGWSNRAFRLWLLELLVGIAFVIAALALLAVAAAPLLLLLAQNEAARVIGIVLTVLLGIPVTLVLIAAAIVVSLLGQFWAREIALRDRGIGEAFSAGNALVRAKVRDVGLFWLLMAGIQIGFSILMIPVFFLLGAVALLIGGGLAYAVWALANSLVGAIVVGLPVFLLLFGLPMLFLSGLFETYKSAAWTLAYREIAPLVPPAPLVTLLPSEA